MKNAHSGRNVSSADVCSSCTTEHTERLEYNTRYERACFNHEHVSWGTKATDYLINY